MSVVVLLGTGALIGLVALTVVVVLTLLTERPESRAKKAPADTAEPTDSDTIEPARTEGGDRSVV